MALVTSENTCSIIITYNPTIDFYNALSRHLLIFKKIVIVDNGSSDLINGQLSAFCNDCGQIELISLNRNFGIAYALNVGIKRGLDLLFSWIVSFDQDSVPSNFLLDYYNRVIESFKDKSKIGLVGVSFTCAGNSLNHNLITWRKSLSLITSGTLYNSDVFRNVGYFDEKLFMDSVDFEFNLRIRKANLLTIRIDQPLIEHKLGDPLEKKILFITVKSSNHGIDRRYYMARNNIVITKRYLFTFPMWIIKKNLFFIKSIFQLIIVETDVKPKLINMFRGIKDGLFSFK